MANVFERELGVPLPQCCSQGDCCKGASPSTPARKLLARAAAGDEFARNFFSIMVPYASHDEARKAVAGLVERTMAAARKSPDFPDPENDVVFYRCRFLQADNRCGVHEDRPQFCRDYPDTPFVVMAPGCAFEPWAAACRTKYQDMKAEVADLHEKREELARLQAGLAASAQLRNDGWESVAPEQTLLPAGDLQSLSLVLSLTPLYLASPLSSFLR